MCLIVYQCPFTVVYLLLKCSVFGQKFSKRFRVPDLWLLVRLMLCVYVYQLLKSGSFEGISVTVWCSQEMTQKAAWRWGSRKFVTAILLLAKCVGVCGFPSHRHYLKETDMSRRASLSCTAIIVCLHWFQTKTWHTFVRNRDVHISWLCWLAAINQSW